MRMMSVYYPDGSVKRKAYAQGTTPTPLELEAAAGGQTERLSPRAYTLKGAVVYLNKEGFADALPCNRAGIDAIGALEPLQGPVVVLNGFSDAELNRDTLMASLKRSGLSDKEASVLAGEFLTGRRQAPPERGDPPVRCEVCGFERIHVYPADELMGVMAVCLQCGAHYHSVTGWLDPEIL